MSFGIQSTSQQCAGFQQVNINKNVLLLLVMALIGCLSFPESANAQEKSPDQDTLPVLYKQSPTRDHTAAESTPSPGKTQGGPFAVQTGGSNPLNGVDVGSESAPALIDIDNDGDFDLFVGEVDGIINYYENTGSVSAATYTLRTGGSNPLDGIDVGSYSFVAFVDIDDDDDFDVFISDESSNVFYYRNTGSVSSPTFSSATSPLTGPGATNENKPSFVDIDNDGDYDVFLGASNGQFVFFENTGSAASATFVQRTGGSHPLDGIDVGAYSSVDFVDMDHDGDWDAFAGEEDGFINYFENTGSAASPTFTVHTGNANYMDGVDVGNYSRPEFADLDNDGDLDLFIGEEDGVFNYYLNNEDPVTTAPGGLFNNIVLWLKADAGVTGTSSVSAWADQTNQSNDAAQATGSRQPSKTDGAINYQPALTFDGTDDFLDVPYSDGLHQGKVQIFSVHKSTDAASFSSPFTSRDGSTTEGYLLYEDTSDLYAFWTAASGSWNAITGGSVTFDSFEIVSISGQTGAGTAEKYIYVDGSQTGSSTTATFDTATGSGSPYRVGAGATESASGNYFWDGDIAEQIVFNVVLSQTERYQVDSYLALKYGIHLTHNYLASDETVLWDATANASYLNDVAGIGRDDASGLNQKQSTSQSGGIVEIGLGTLASDNASNANSFSGDLAFMVWGHDNASTSVSTAFSGSSTNTRMARIWKVEETSTVGTVEIQIPDSYGATHLIVSSSSALTSPTETALTDNGDGTMSTTVNFADGEFFSFGTAVVGPAGITAGLSLWLKADTGVTESSGNVSIWADQSANGNNATDNGAANLPAFSSTDLNYNPIVEFDASNTEGLKTSSLFGTSSHSDVNIFVVAEVNTITASHLFIEGPSTSRVGTDLPWTDNTINWDAGGVTGVNRLGTSWSSSLATPYIWSFEYESSSSRQAIYRDGASFASDATASSFSLSSTYEFEIAATVSNAEYADADIAEIIVFDGALTDTEQDKIETYLSLKYGISQDQNYLASDGTTLWDATANATYHNDVAGIGRDDDSVLNQKQSTSHSGGVVEIGLGALASDNASNANSFSGDLAFMIWGHDNASTTVSTAFSGSSTNTRMARIWKVEETSTVGTVEIQIPDSYGATHLIVSSSSALTSPTETALSDNGDGTLSTTVNFSNGQFFSFGNSSVGPGGVSSNLALWLKADAGVTESSNNVTAWADQSSMSYDFSDVGASNYTYDADGMNYNPEIVNSDGSDRRLANTTSTTLYTVALVTDPDNPGNWDNPFSEVGADDEGIRSLSNAWSIPGNADDFANPSGQAWFNGTGSTDPAHGNVPNIILVEAPAAAVFSGGIELGDTFNNRYWHGSIAEIVGYSTTLSTSDREQVQSYLAVKYGITVSNNYLASDGTTLWDATANTTYHNDVAGIGRDDESALNQKQSTSQSGGIVEIGLGALASDNASNANSFAGDLAFMLWGHDNASTSVATAFSGSSTNVRMARVWKVEETSTVGTVEIQIPDSYSATHLIVSSSSALTSPTETVLTDNGDGTLSTTVNLTDGQFFTFGASTIGPGGVTADLELWLKADVGVTESSNVVSAWADQSGNGNDGSQATGSYQPTYESNALNYNPGILFAEDFLTTTLDINATSVPDASVIFVYTPSVDPAGSLWGISNGDWNRCIWDDASYNNSIAIGTLSSVDNVTDLFVANQPNISTIAFDEDAANGSSAYVNGTLQRQFTSDHAGLAANSFSIGTWGGGAGAGSKYNGRVYEGIVYSGLLATQDLNQVETYLGLKYGITLDHNYEASDATTLWDATVNATYHNDIAGIGRDDNSELNQKQSTSQSGGIVEIGLGALASDNASNANSFAGDLAFMVWGHDNASTSVATAFSGSSTNVRMARIWKVEETSTVGTVELQIPDSYGVTHLIVSSSSALTSPTETALTDNGDGTMSTTVNFTDGQFFSFGISTLGPGGIADDLKLWLKADAGVYSDNGCATALTSSDTADALGCWEDQSPNGYVTTQASAGLRADHAIGGLNYNPVFTFDETEDDRLDFSTALISAPSDVHAYYVIDENDADGDNHLLASETGGRFYLRTMTASFGDNATVTETVPGGTFLANATYDVGTTTMTFSVDAGTPISETQNWSTAPTGDFKLGAHGSGSGSNANQYNGDLAEMIVYTADHGNVNDAQKIRSYLAIKYGLTLSEDLLATDGTTLWDATTNAAYHNDVLAIGRGDDTELNQKQSTASIVAVGLGGVAASNAANANSFSTDQTFLVLGHNAGALTESQVIIGAYTADQLGRVWYAEETSDTGGTLEFQFDLTGVGVSGTTAAEFQLVLDTDTDPTNGTRQIIAATSYASDIVTFSSVDVADNDYLILLTDYDLPPAGPPVVDGVAADGVLGQPDYDSSAQNNGGVSSTSLNGPGFLTMGPTGKVFVADSKNHRVLRWSSVNAAMDGSAAEAVLGQADFTSNSANRGGVAAANTMYEPTGIFVTSSGALFVADSQNHRILRFDNAESASDGANADGVLGQADFVSTEENRRKDVAANSLRWPKDLFVDSGGRLWAVDWLNHRVLRYDNATAKADGADADGVLGQAGFTTRILEWQNQTDINSFAYPGGVYVDASGRLWVSDAGNSRVLRFDGAASKANGADADGVLGQADFTSWRVNRGSTMNATTLHWPDAGLDGDNQGGLWVADRWNDRVLWYEDAATKADGAAADAVLGQADFTSIHGLVDNASFNSVHDVFVDTSSDQVWVVDSAHNRVLRFDAAANSLGKSVDSPELFIEEIPTVFDLYQNYPNPFNPQTTIGYDIPEPVHVSIHVYDVLGRPVQMLVNEVVPAGKHEVRFEAGNLAAGIYFYQMRAGNEVHIKKMILAK